MGPFVNFYTKICNVEISQIIKTSQRALINYQNTQNTDTVRNKVIPKLKKGKLIFMARIDAKGSKSGNED